jgi:micrococcal nuclease
MLNQNKFTWSTAKVIALCCAVFAVTLYGATRLSLSGSRSSELAKTMPATAPVVSLPPAAPENAPSEEPQFLKVSTVSAGDVLSLDDGTKVNLLGVSCPKMDETDPSRLAIAREALAFTTGAILDKEVRLEYEPAHLTDGQGRTLAYVYLRDGTLLNGELVKRGYGNAFTRYAYRFGDEFRKDELEAKNHKVGLWEEREANTAEGSNDDQYYTATDSSESSTDSTSSTSSSTSTNATTRPRSASDLSTSSSSRGSSAVESTYQAQPTQTYVSPPRASYLIPSTPPRFDPGPRVAENGSYYGEISERTGRPKTVQVQGYTRRDGTYVRGHFRSSPRR